MQKEIGSTGAQGPTEPALTQEELLEIRICATQEGTRIGDNQIRLLDEHTAQKTELLILRAGDALHKVCIRQRDTANIELEKAQLDRDDLRLQNNRLADACRLLGIDPDETMRTGAVYVINPSADEPRTVEELIKSRNAYMKAGQKLAQSLHAASLGHDEGTCEEADARIAELEALNVCWHCLVCLVPEPNHCERCPPPNECDNEGCEAEGCVNRREAQKVSE